MAITPTVTVESYGELGSSGNDQYVIGTITVTGTYATGGFAVDIPAGGADLSNIRVLKASGSGRLLEWDVTNQKLLVKAWATAGATVAATEITNGTDIGATSDSYRFIAIGQ
jgi:hypothetical protein